MGGVPVGLAAARAAVEVAAADAAGLIGSASGPDLEKPARGLDWTVGQTAAHVVASTRSLGGLALRRIAPEPGVDLAEVNLSRIAQVGVRDPAALADLLVEEAARFLADTAGRPADDSFPFYGGATANLAAVTAILLGEYLVHCLDIARSLGRPWRIDPGHARLVIAGSTAVLPAYVDGEAARDVTVAYDVRVRGGPRFTFRLAEGRASVEPARAGPVDCHISADPVAFLLVSYGREPQWRPILLGRLAAWGRRPWRAFAFKRLLADP
ncbi:MAG TPA: maleylpyruvate isomerase family mycothiol-dependent enzyme [Actinomycetes bacterium]